MKIFTPIVLALFASFSMNSMHAQESSQLPPIIFIYDASGSMWGQMEGRTKMEIAAEVLAEALDGLPEGQATGLVAYGHRKKGDCEDVEILVSAKDGDKRAVKEALAGIKPLGKTPLAWSARQVIDRLRSSGMKATVILLTDGIESCGGDICEVVKAAREEGIEFRMHIIGFGIGGEDTEQLECAAAEGGGQYYDAENAGDLSAVLDEATNSTVDKPQYNFSVYAVKNGESIDAHVQAFKAGSKTHFAAARTYRDTAYLYLPPGNYDLEIKPLAGSAVDAIRLSAVESSDDKMMHETVSFDGGKILVHTLNNHEGWDATVTIYTQDGSPVTRGRTYGQVDEYELNPGTYDVFVQALLINGTGTSHTFEDVVVEGNRSTRLDHNFESGIAMIGAKSADGLVDAVVKIVEKASGTQVAGGRTYTSESNNPRKFILNPGVYTVSLSALGAHSGKSDSYTLEVKTGETVEKIVTF